MGTIKLPTKRSEGVVDISQIRFLLYGPPKIGKTTLASGFENTLILATEKGYGSMKVFALDVKSWKDFIECVDLIESGDHDYKTIVIDTVSILYDLCVKYVCDENNVEHASDGSYGKVWSLIGTEFERQINRLFLTDYGIILISHFKCEEVVSTTGTKSQIAPDLPKPARRILVPKVSVIGYMKTKTEEVDGKYITKREITFKPSDFIEAGDRDGYLPSSMQVFKDPEKTYQEFLKYYNKKPTNEKQTKEETTKPTTTTKKNTKVKKPKTTTPVAKRPIRKRTR